MVNNFNINNVFLMVVLKDIELMKFSYLQFWYKVVLKFINKIRNCEEEVMLGNYYVIIGFLFVL